MKEIADIMKEHEGAIAQLAALDPSKKHILVLRFPDPEISEEAIFRIREHIAEAFDRHGINNVLTFVFGSCEVDVSMFELPG